MAIEDLYIDPVTGDIAQDADGNVLFCEGQVRAGQQLWARLTTERGSWFRDESFGARWRAKILALGATDTEIRAEIAREGVRTPGIARIDEVDVTRIGDAPSAVSFRAVTTAGLPVGEAIIV